MNAWRNEKPSLGTLSYTKSAHFPITTPAYERHRFFEACKRNKLCKASCMLSHMPCVNVVSDDGQWSALTIAAYNNSLDVLEWLLTLPGIDVNQRSLASIYFDKKWTAIMFACRAGLETSNMTSLLQYYHL